MSTISSSFPGDVEKVIATAVAHQIERMTKEEVQALVEQARLDFQSENEALKRRIVQLEQDAADKEREKQQLAAERDRLAWELSRRLFDEKEWDNFDPSQFHVTKQETLAAIDAVKEQR